MTSFSLSSAPRCVFIAAALVAALAAGCGPDDGSAEYESGVAAYETRDLERAVKRFRESLDLAPDRVDAWVMLSRACLDLGDMAAAKEAVSRAAELAPGDVDVVELSAQLAYHAKDFKKAMSLYSDLAKSQDAAVSSRAYCALAVVEMAAGTSGADERRDRARTFLLAAVKLDGRNAAARYHLGLLYCNSFAYPEAALDQFGIFANLAEPSDGLQKVVDSNRLKKVKEQYIPGLRANIDRANAQRPGADRRDSAKSAAALKAADDAWKKGRFKDARAKYAEAYSADVLNYQAALALAEATRKVDPSNGGLAEAFKHYKAASQLRPSSRDTLMTLGDLAMKLGRHAAAAEAYSRAVAARPYDISAIDGLVRALRKCGNAKSAAIYQNYRDFVSPPKGSR